MGSSFEGMVAEPYPWSGFAYGAIVVGGFFDLELPPPASLILNHRGFWKCAGN
jgi:hypothetical protein